MRHFKKMTAAVMAVATLATNIVPLSADALYFNENSKFAYDLAVESERDGTIKVTFYTTYNPGVDGFSMALKYDTDKLEYESYEMDILYQRSTLKAVSENESRQMVISLAATLSGGDYFEPISFSYYFKPKNMEEKETYRFSACVYQYVSLTEGISFGSNIHDLPVVPDETTKTVEKSEYTRKIGDVIPSNLVDMKDVTELMGIISFLNACTTTSASSTMVLNDMLTMDRSYTLQNGKTGTYRDRLKNSLYVNDIPFAEVADCDQNGVIEQKDGDLLITYCAQAAANQDPETLINKEISKVVYADITM